MATPGEASPRIRGFLPLAAATLVALAVCRPAAVDRAVSIPAGVLARADSGDLIFRRGTALISDAVRWADDGAYSHVGLLVHVAHGWQVIHAAPAAMPGHADVVRRTALERFEAPRRARAIAIYHVDSTPAQRNRAVAAARATLGQPFGFDADGTYCSELVWSAWRDAGVSLEVAFTPVHLPLADGDYLTLSSLRQSPRMHRLWRSDHS